MSYGNHWEWIKVICHGLSSRRNTPNKTPGSVMRRVLQYTDQASWKQFLSVIVVNYRCRKYTIHQNKQFLDVWRYAVNLFRSPILIKEMPTCLHMHVYNNAFKNRTELNLRLVHVHTYIVLQEMSKTYLSLHVKCFLSRFLNTCTIKQMKFTLTLLSYCHS